MNDRKKERVRKILSWVLAGFTGVILSVAVLFLFFGKVVCKSEVWHEEALKTDYAEKMRALVKEQYSSISLTTGVPAELSDAYVEKALTDEIALYAFTHPETRNEIDLSDFREGFLAEVRTLAAKMEENGEIYLSSEEEREEMDGALQGLADDYTQTLRNSVLLRGVFSGLAAAKGYYDSLKLYVYGALALFGVISLALLFLINKKRVFPYLYAAFSSAGVLLIGLTAGIRIWNGVPRLSVEPDYLKDWIVALSGRFLTDTMIAGAALLAAGLLFGAAAMIVKRKTTTPENASGEEKTKKTDENNDHQRI